jgi:thioredoxin-dependent peroxiredoxin
MATPGPLVSTGRNFGEALRLLGSRRLTPRHSVATPVNWDPGRDVIIPPAISDEAATEIANGWRTVKPYPRAAAQPQD